MFDTRFPEIALSGPAVFGAAHRVRRLTWAEIVTRADGLRQVRRVAEFVRAGLPGSFDPKAAHRIAMNGHGIHAVNPTGLGIRKAADGNGTPVNDTHVRAS